MFCARNTEFTRYDNLSRGKCVPNVGNMQDTQVFRFISLLGREEKQTYIKVAEIMSMYT